jgi:hypothetical protein
MSITLTIPGRRRAGVRASSTRPSLLLATAALSAGALLPLAGAQAASAAEPDPFTVGYVWENQPSRPGCHAPAAAYSYASQGGANVICRDGVGAYTVKFPRLASPGGNVQVTAYGSTAAACKVGLWVPRASEEQVVVSCTGPGGVPRDASFTASFTAGGGAPNTVAFAWANNPTAPSYVPSSTYQYNNRGGLASVTHGPQPGAYTVSFPNRTGAPAGGSVKVTAYGPGSGTCKVVSWVPNAGASAEVVRVQCHDSAGRPSNERFSIVYADAMNFLGDNVLAAAYAWADRPATASYTPSLPYQRSTTLAHAGTVTARRTSPGLYDVFLPRQNEGTDGGHAQVTAYGSDPSRCQIGHWNDSPGGRTVQVACTTPTGAPVDTHFDLVYTGKLR